MTLPISLLHMDLDQAWELAVSLGLESEFVSKFHISQEGCLSNGYHQSMWTDEFLQRVSLDEARILRLAGERVSDISPLAGCRHLETLVCIGVAVTDISPLAKCPQLAKVFFDRSAVTCVDALSGLKKLQIVSLRETTVADLSPLRGSTSLEQIFFGDTPVTDLTPLSNLDELHTMNFDSTLVSDLSPILDLPSLCYVSAYGCPVPGEQIEYLLGRGVHVIF